MAPITHDQLLPPPVGFRFRPREEELILTYLYNKVTGNPFTNWIVKDCDLYGHSSPSQIWDAYGCDHRSLSADNTEAYFFTKLKKVTPDGKRIARTVGNGTWHAEDSGAKIMGVFQGRKQCLGLKKRFKFDKSGTSDDRKWIMMEYSLHPNLLGGVRVAPELADIVLCKIKKNFKGKNQREPPVEVEETSQPGRKRSRVEHSSDNTVSTEDSVTSRQFDLHSSLGQTVNGYVEVEKQGGGNGDGGCLGLTQEVLPDSVDDFEDILSFIDFCN